MKTESLLVLKNDSFRQETTALFDLLGSNPMARQNFIKNPAGVMRSMFSFAHDDLPINQGDSEANRLLFSIVSNPKFIDFLKKQETSADNRLKGLFETLPTKDNGTIDKAQVLKEFTEAFAQYGDKEILEGLFTADGALAGSPDLAPVLIVLLLVVVGVFTVAVFAVNHDAIPTGPTVSVAEMRGLAEALATAARNARTTGQPFVQTAKHLQSPSAESSRVETIGITESKRETVNA